MEAYLARSYETWRSLSEDHQKLVTNILYMHTRVSAYEWDWEQFSIAYMVFDGCYRFLSERDRIGAPSHGLRISTVLQHLGIQQNLDWQDRFVKLRNDLFHESLWDTGQPGTFASDTAFYVPIFLKSMNARVITAMLGYKGKYPTTCWWSLGQSSF